jgi:hypothetical protein
VSEFKPKGCPPVDEFDRLDKQLDSLGIKGEVDVTERVVPRFEGWGTRVYRRPGQTIAVSFREPDGRVGFAPQLDKYDEKQPPTLKARTNTYDAADTPRSAYRVVEEIGRVVGELLQVQLLTESASPAEQAA